MVYDPNGQWYVNVGAFPFTDPVSGARFEPGIRTQATPTSWVKGQPVLKPEKEEVKVTQAPAK